MKLIIFLGALTYLAGVAMMPAAIQVVLCRLVFGEFMFWLTPWMYLVGLVGLLCLWVWPMRGQK